MAKYVYVFQQDCSEEIPAAVLETRLGDGEVVQRIPVPARTFSYKQGQEVTLRNKKDRDVFLQKWGDKVEVKS